MTVELALALGATTIPVFVVLLVLRRIIFRAIGNVAAGIRSRRRRRVALVIRVAIDVILRLVLWIVGITFALCVAWLAWIGLGYLWAAALGKDTP